MSAGNVWEDEMEERELCRAGAAVEVIVVEPEDMLRLPEALKGFNDNNGKLGGAIQLYDKYVRSSSRGLVDWKLAVEVREDSAVSLFLMLRQTRNTSLDSLHDFYSAQTVGFEQPLQFNTS